MALHRAEQAPAERIMEAINGSPALMPQGGGHRPLAEARAVIECWRIDYPRPGRTRRTGATPEAVRLPRGRWAAQLDQLRRTAAPSGEEDQL